MEKQQEIKVKQEELDNLKYFIENSKKEENKTALYVAFVKGIERKLKEVKDD
jgi:hypothetical protein